MIRSLDDWHEHAKMFDDAFPRYDADADERKNVRNAASRYLKDGFHDWVIEDANNKHVPMPITPNMQQIAECVKLAERPVRITLVIHPAGDGVAHAGRRRTSLVRLKPHVWFCEQLEDKDELLRNIQKGMPPELVSLIYGISQSWACVLGQKHGFKLEGVR